MDNYWFVAGTGQRVYQGYQGMYVPSGIDKFWESVNRFMCALKYKKAQKAKKG